MNETVDCKTEKVNEYPVVLNTRKHVLHADVSVADGGADSAPGPHDLFDAALASCKALTAMWYAKRHAIPLERVETHVARDASEKGVYRLQVRIEFFGPMNEEQRARLTRAVGACPIHKLMTQSDIHIETTGG